MILICFTTAYREGGASFERVARALGDERLRLAAMEGTVPGDFNVVRVDSKREWVDAMVDHSRTSPLRELHFVGHAGMYGPMMGTTSWPEQLSPHEWRSLLSPESGLGPVRLAEDAQVFIHTCRSARWFAPFLARTWGVTCWGNHWYTTFSAQPDRFVHPWRASSDAPLYLFGCPGKTSHGWLASAHKHLFGGAPERMCAFTPNSTGGAESYDAVAAAYDQTFADIGVRAAEVGWIEARIKQTQRAPRILEIGCGNGALLDRLAPVIAAGIGVDASASMIEYARRRVARHPHLRVAQIKGPSLPAPDGSVDCVVSMLSWRYLDWGPMLEEISRVLTPEGTLWVVDMVEKPARSWELPRLLRDRLREIAAAFRARDFRRARSEMVRSSPWRRLVAHNPMRALHEYEWFFRSRFPEVKVKTLSLGRRARVMAYDCGAMSRASLQPLQYP